MFNDAPRIDRRKRSEGCHDRGVQHQLPDEVLLLCPYCGKEPELVSGLVVYPHRADLRGKSFYRCAPCDAYVGCHPGTTNALGRLANAELRKAKQAAHVAFDPLWKSGAKKRGSAYTWLCDQLQIEKKDCHIGMFDVETCRRVVEVCQGA